YARTRPPRSSACRACRPSIASSRSSLGTDSRERTARATTSACDVSRPQAELSSSSRSASSSSWAWSSFFFTEAAFPKSPPLCLGPRRTVREVVAGHGLRRLVRLVEERSAGVRRMRALALGRLALELAARELPVPQLLDAPPVHARRIDPGQLRWGAGAGRNASRTTRRTR